MISRLKMILQYGYDYPTKLHFKYSKKFPKVIEGHFLIWNESKLTYLPKNFEVTGCLDLDGCKNLHELPEGLTVGGRLDITDTSITKLPKNYKVAGPIYKDF